VRDARIIPHWIGGTDKFGRRHETADGEEFIAMDARTVAKALAFDEFSNWIPRSR
jgi:hypothetical protein